MIDIVSYETSFHLKWLYSLLQNIETKNGQLF